MSFNPGGGGGISGATDVFLSSPTNGQALTYDSGVQKWRNAAVAAGLTAAVSTTTSGSITLTPGSSAQLTKLKSTLTGNVTVTLASGADNSYFDLSFIETVFGAYTVTIGSDSFAYPTYVRYVRIGGAWERVL